MRLSGRERKVGRDGGGSARMRAAALTRQRCRLGVAGGMVLDVGVGDGGEDKGPSEGLGQGGGAGDKGGFADGAEAGGGAKAAGMEGIAGMEEDANLTEVPSPPSK